MNSTANILLNLALILILLTILVKNKFELFSFNGQNCNLDLMFQKTSKKSSSLMMSYCDSIRTNLHSYCVFSSPYVTLQPLQPTTIIIISYFALAGVDLFAFELKFTLNFDQTETVFTVYAKLRSNCDLTVLRGFVMVYLHFPTNLTEEEIVLQNKYAKLRKKKKALQALKAPRQEPEPIHPVKRPSEAKDAKEYAKKLIRSGAIRSIERRDDNKEKTTFKRSKGLERKLSGSDRALSGYQPFSASHPEDEPPPPPPAERDKEFRPGNKTLYDSFISARDKEERSSSRDVASDKPRQGNTVYVRGYGVTEQLLRRSFQKFGAIVNISMEIEKNCGFLTFDKMEAAERSIAAMSGTTVDGVQLQVSYARRQPKIEPINDASTSSAWSTIAASHSQKGLHNKDQRNVVTYDDAYF
ncbi:negative elongation factor E-like isoform X2 [Amphibalanus amphitrite]|uniref:negative elongation factor E-like isoform X2 n=1 Tax=Amphibalanus amphitrite TaxID=1232801 RepID=UPI001C91963C|nr:negative elongation factor E-like isoform X2 [Amphibalanus amphitrite]